MGQTGGGNGGTDGRDGRLPIPWSKVGYGLTAAWMVFVLIVTKNDVGHPLFNYIFRVPLVVWVTGLVIAHLVKRLGRR